MTPADEGSAVKRDQAELGSRTPGELRAYYDGVDTSLRLAGANGLKETAEIYALIPDDQKGRTNAPGAPPRRFEVRLETAPFQAACDAFKSVAAEEIAEALNVFEDAKIQAEARCAHRIDQWAAKH